jgi:hypothetical protein
MRGIQHDTLFLSSLRTQGPITTDAWFGQDSGSSFVQHRHSGLWISARASLGRDDDGWEPNFKHTSAISRRDAPEPCMNPSPNKGRGECRVPTAPRSLACKVKKHTSIVTTVAPESPGIPARNGFNGFLRALPVIGLVCHRRPADCSADLTPASRRQDHTTSPSASAPFVNPRCRVHRIPHPTSVTIAKRPSVWGGTADDIDLIWIRRERKYF